MAQEFEEAGARVLGISVDSIHSHREYAKQRDIPFELLSDFNKETARQYGVLMDLGPWKGVARRSVFVIDKDGTIAYAWKGEQASDLPDIGEVLEEARQASGDTLQQRAN